MDLYVQNASGYPVRVVIVRLEQEPDVFAIVVNAKDVRPADIKGRVVFDRVLRNPKIGELVPWVTETSTLRFYDRFAVRVRVTHDRDGDKVFVIESLMN